LLKGHVLTHSDEQELLRLTSILESIYEGLEDDPARKEALQKAALALSVSFIHGLRSEVERLYGTRGKPLPEAERARLRELGLDGNGDDDG
jgi:hypothetical protein